MRNLQNRRHAQWHGHRHARARGTTVIIKDTPAEVCRNCGEYYLSEEATAHVHELAEEAVRHGAEIEVLRYAPVSV